MPLYEFKCNCGNVFDQVVPVGAESCRCDCGKKAQRVFTMPHTILKGGGWTTTDKVMQDQLDDVKQKTQDMGENI